MPIFEAEMFRRAWWCTYIIDRRLALDTGRPFLIQDVNTDVSLPLELVDSWLSNHIKTRRTGKELETEIEKEISRKITTPVRHIIDMVSFSRVVGKVWEAQYGAMGRNSHPTSLTTEYLELLISSMAQVNSPTELFGSTEIFHGQFAWMEWWQIKQMMLMRIVSCIDYPHSGRLLIIILLPTAMAFSSITHSQIFASRITPARDG